MWMWTPTNRRPASDLPLAIHLPRVLQRHTELVALQPGRDVRMAPGVDVWIDAQGDARFATERARHRGDAIEFPGRFGVDRSDPLSDRELELVVRLAHAGEDDVRRREAGAKGHFAPRRRSWRRHGCRATAAGGRWPASSSLSARSGSRGVRCKGVVDRPDRRRGSLAHCRCRPECRPERRQFSGHACCREQCRWSLPQTAVARSASPQRVPSVGYRVVDRAAAAGSCCAGRPPR